MQPSTHLYIRSTKHVHVHVSIHMHMHMLHAPIDTPVYTQYQTYTCKCIYTHAHARAACNHTCTVPIVRGHLDINDILKAMAGGENCYNFHSLSLGDPVARGASLLPWVKYSGISLYRPPTARSVRRPPAGFVSSAPLALSADHPPAR